MRMSRKDRRNRGIYQARTKQYRADAEPTPKMWACPFCGGPSTDQEGHSACLVRHGGKAAA